MLGAETILGDGVFEWLLNYGYPVLIGLTIIDCTYVGFFAGVLSSVGIFNPFIVFGIGVIVRILTDSIIFFSAKSGSSFLSKFSFSKKIIERTNKKLEINNKEWIDWTRRNIFKLLFVAKIIPIPGFPEAVLIVGGVVNASYKRIFYGILFGQALWAAIVISLGYYYGDVVQSSSYLLNVIGFTAALIILLFFIYRRYGREYIKKTLFYRYFLNGNSPDKKV